MKLFIAMLLPLFLFIGPSLTAQVPIDIIVHEDSVTGPFSLVEITHKHVAYKAWCSVLGVDKIPRSEYKQHMSRLGEYVGVKYDGRSGTNQCIINAPFFYLRHGKLYFEDPGQDPNVPSHKNKSPEKSTRL